MKRIRQAVSVLSLTYLTGIAALGMQALGAHMLTATIFSCILMAGIFWSLDV